MPNGVVPVVTGNSVTAPAVVMRPIWSAPASVNQSAPSGPAAMSAGAAPAVMPVPNSVSTPAAGTAPPRPAPPYAAHQTPPAVVIRPIWSAPLSVNHKAPSGPAAMPTGPAVGPVGVPNSVRTPAVVMAPTWPELNCVNQSRPSGPAAMPSGLLPEASVNSDT